MNDSREEPLVDALRRIKVFEGLDDTQRHWLAERMEDAHFAVGQDLFVPGAVADRMMAIVAGQIEVVMVGTNEPFLFLHEGDVSGLLPYSRMTVLRGTARATRPTRVALLHKEHFPGPVARVAVGGRTARVDAVRPRPRLRGS